MDRHRERAGADLSHRPRLQFMIPMRIKNVETSHTPPRRCDGSGLLSPALSCRGGEGEDSGPLAVREFKARIDSGRFLPDPLPTPSSQEEGISCLHWQ